jgi:parallel beta-helix repeat protein
MLVRGGSYSHNGQMGMGGAGNQSVVEGVELAYNNYAGFMPTWEAGGAKFVFSNELVIRNNCVHHNYGNGIWTDIDNINITIEGNKVFDNEGSGIMHEISYKATIRNNTVVRNGRNKYDWLWGSQIVVQNSQDVEVHGNIVEVAPDFGNGISLIYQNRGAGKYGPYLTAKNNVRDNQVILTGAKGKSGMVADFEGDRFWNQMGNKFHKNSYVAPANNGANWSFKGDKSWSEVQASGFEESSTLKLAARPPMAVSCAKSG